MDIQQLWDQINDKVDWFITGIIALLIANLATGFFVAGVYLSEEEFFEKHRLSPVGDIQQQLAMLENIPELDEIEIPEHQEPGPLPERYAELHGSDIFIPLEERMRAPDDLIAIDDIDEEDLDDTEAIQRRLPLIAGFEVVGRIVDKNREIRIGMLKRVEDGAIFRAHEGEYLENTDIKVVEVSDTVIRIAKPEHRTTEFQFDIDRMHQELEQFIRMH